MDTYRVKNRSAGVAVYRIPELGIRRSFIPGEVKKISADELEKLTYQPGGLALLSNFLQILDEEGIKQAGIHTEPEYFMSEEDIVKLMKTGSVDAFLDCLDFAPPGVIDIIKRLSVSLPLEDMNKRIALKEKIGFDVDAAIRHVMEEKEDEKPTDNGPKRRVQPAATTAVEEGRRTAAPKYNVVSTNK